MTTLYYRTHGSRYTVEKYDDYEETVGAEWVTSVHLSTPGYPFDQFETESTYVLPPKVREQNRQETFKEGDVVYVLEVNYTTGSTFGSDSGNLAVKIITKKPELALLVQNNLHNSKFWDGLYREWEGYFEKYDSCRVSTFVVMP